MAGYVVSDSELESVADAIRTKGGTSAQLEWPGDFVDAIDDIPTGASNIVSGTFKGTTTGAAMDVTLNYSGSGHPIGIIIFPTDGFKSGDPAYDLIHRYAVIHVCGVKLDQDAPTYESSGDNNRALVYGTYKNNASSATSMAAGGSRNTIFFSGDDATTGTFLYNAIKFKSNTKMSVFIASTSYGFAANIEYTYHVIYSS